MELEVGAAHGRRGVFCGEAPGEGMHQIELTEVWINPNDGNGIQAGFHTVVCGVHSAIGGTNFAWRQMTARRRGIKLRLSLCHSEYIFHVDWLETSPLPCGLDIQHVHSCRGLCTSFH